MNMYMYNCDIYIYIDVDTLDPWGDEYDVSELGSWCIRLVSSFYVCMLCRSSQDLYLWFVNNKKNN